MNTEKPKFCVNCRWCQWFEPIADYQCQIPSVDRVTGNDIWMPCRMRRSDTLEECGPDAKLFELKEAE